MNSLVFIVIDGLDASGKSTQAFRLYNFLKSGGKRVFLRFHPSNDNFFGIKAKQFLYSKGKSAHFAAALFYMVDVIRSILFYYWRKFDYIIFVRYLMGTAYLPSPLHRIAYHFFALVVPKSNFMFFLDVTPEEAYKRIQHGRKRREIFESLKELKRIRRKALFLALIDEWKIVNANKPAAEIAREIKDQL
ncbi:thymidylate kinase [Candidatus Bathyarchaeota archaeon A05DMB-5]|jgi:dTMP kinase|nr:thymidylate kinase [Candidatus Bathyarchaeota archaeon A05DMB-5]